MSSQAKIALTSLVLLAAVSIFAYQSFNNFKPKNLQPLEEVHGAAIGAVGTSDIPFPQDYVLLGTTQTENTKQITFEAPIKADEVQKFYRNIFTAKGWEVEYEGKAGTFFNTGYKLAQTRVKVSSAPQDGTDRSVVSVEITTL